MTKKLPIEKQSASKYIKELKILFTQFPLIIKLLWQAYPFGIITIPILTLLVAPLPPFFIYCTKKILDGLSLWLQGDVASGRQIVFLFLCLTFGARLLQGILDRCLSLLQRLFQLRLNGVVQNKILDKAGELDMTFFETPSFYDKLQRAKREASMRPYAVLSSILNGTRQVITLLGFLLVLASLAWWVAPLLLLLTLPSLHVQMKFGRMIWATLYNRTPEERRMLYHQELLTSNQYAKELRLFGLIDLLKSQWLDLFWRFYHHDLRIAIRHSFAQFTVLLFQTVLIAGFYIFAIYRTITDPVVTIGSFVMYTQAMNSSMGSLSGFLNAISTMYENNLYLSQLFEYLALRPQLRSPARLLRPPKSIRGGICFESVSFRYPGSTKNVLENISFEVKAGEKVAIVGENGAGKTTLIKLLSKLYEPQEGRITVDGIDLRKFDPKTWYQHIGIIFQDFARYWMTARENVGFGHLNYMNDMTRIRKAAELSGAKECIERLEHGWETILGKLFDEGQELSIGEWQRIALARAFMRDAQILVLDEPTASLDAKREYEIFVKFNELSLGKTTFLISHRFSTVRMVDRIFVIEGGQLVESGSHEELMSLGNRYAELFTRQAATYR